MKQSILFSDILGGGFGKEETKGFIPKMNSLLNKINLSKYVLVYVDAPFDGYDSKVVFNRVMSCFKKLKTSFKDVIYLSEKSDKFILPEGNVCWFLTGGNPLTQMQIIKKHNLEELILNADFVIGYCAGAINISQNSIITSDDDFQNAFSYNAIKRLKITVEPHFSAKHKTTEKEFYYKRVGEINNFCKTLNCDIIAITDKCVINVIDDKVKVYGKRYVFKKPK